MKNKKTPTGQGKGGNLTIEQYKDIKFRSQLQIVSDEFELLPSTMLEISLRTGIPRSSICGYVAILQIQELIFLIGKGLCSISNHRAGFYTTNRQLFNELKDVCNE